MRYRLYTPVIGNGSFSRVGAGIRGALERAGLLAGVVPLDAMDPYVDYDGATADSAIMVGPPHFMDRLKTMGMHKERLLMLAPNSSWIPDDLSGAARDFLTGILSPSQWGADIIRQYTEVPVEVYSHGVDEGFSPDKAQHAEMVRMYDAGSFRVAHLASTDRERKGTRELLRAWVTAVAARQLGPDPMLRLVLDVWTSERMCTLIEDLSRGNPAVVRTITISLTRNFTVGAAAKFYRQHHVVCQPSRGEGFGCIPLESRACGVPVVATDCTGHRAHVVRGSAGVIVVPTGTDEPIDDGPEAVAPSLDWQAVCDALVDGHERWVGLGREAQYAAEGVRYRWSWDQVTREWLGSRGRQ